MPDGSWKKRDVVCPFYRDDDWKEKRISCEGVFDRSRSAHRFSRRDEYLQQMELFCCGQWEKCEVARMILEAKYPEK